MVKELIKAVDWPTDLMLAANEYLFLESKVNFLISQACSCSCRECKDRCCRKEYCSESVSSCWLRIIWTLCSNDISNYDEEKGWLSPYGCHLTAGRPPVCYDFFCNRILEKNPMGTYVASLIKISKLPGFIGKNALGTRHLVTLSSKEVFRLLNFNRLRNRIAKCLELCEQCERQL
jgi:hypothetical protein